VTKYLTFQYLTFYLGLNCYSCSSTNLLLDEDCSSGSSNIPNITCQPDLNFCVTVKTESTVSRTCWATNSSDGADGDWIFCDYDVCNNNNGKIKVINKISFKR